MSDKTAKIKKLMKENEKEHKALMKLKKEVKQAKKDAAAAKEKTKKMQAVLDHAKAVIAAAKK